LQDICKILNGEADIDVDSDIIVKLKYAPITSVDVERSFSAYKNILSDRRHNLTMASIEQHLIIIEVFLLMKTIFRVLYESL
jgi:hypothetical protein